MIGRAGPLRRLPAGLARFADALIGVIVAPECAACARPLEAPTAGPVCAACWTAVRRFTPPLCPSCGDPAPGTRASAGGRRHGELSPSACLRCRRTSGPIARARAAGPYEGRLRDIIHAFKYDRRRTLGEPLAGLLRDAGRDVLDGADAVVPVPLHWARRHQRGFNQAALMAAGLGLPVCDALRRARRTRAQAELPAGERHVNVAGAFTLAWRYRRPWLRPGGNRAPARLDGLTVVLVDDVSTTGATLEACARVLTAAGVREVRALTVARVAARPR